MPQIKFRRPSPAMVVALVALFVVMGGSAVAATTMLIHTKDIANGAVTNRKLANGAIGMSKLARSIRSELTKAGKSRGIVTGPRGFNGANGASGKNGSNGSSGNNGRDGRDGANPGVAVVDVPSIAQSSGKNPNPDSGDPGDGGWYFSGNGTGGSAALTNGELEVSGVGVDGNTAQGGIGIAKAFNNVALGNLNALSYTWHVNEVNGSQAPSVHVTLTGAKPDSKFGSGFTNLDYTPAINNGNTTPVVGQSFQSDAFAPGAKWFSTDEPSINDPGGQNNPRPLSFFATHDPSAVITQISLDNGGSSGASGSFDAGADNLILGFGNSFTRYDFGG